VKAVETILKGCFVIEPSIYADERGVFYESYNQRKLEDLLGRELNFVQDNHSVSKRGVMRGMHFQRGEHAQAKLIRVPKGKVLDVVVDLRPDSPTYLKHFKQILSDTNNKMLYLPRGFAHGFLSLEADTHFTYKCDNYYNPASEAGLMYDDPALGIEWGFSFTEMVIAEKDLDWPLLKTNRDD